MSEEQEVVKKEKAKKRIILTSREGQWEAKFVEEEEDPISQRDMRQVERVLWRRFREFRTLKVREARVNKETKGLENVS